MTTISFPIIKEFIAPTCRYVMDLSSSHSVCPCYQGKQTLLKLLSVVYVCEARHYVVVRTKTYSKFCVIIQVSLLLSCILMVFYKEHTLLTNH